MGPPTESSQSDEPRKSGAQSSADKQATTWLTPEQIEKIRDACLTDAFPGYLQGRNETIITLLADTGLRVSELVAIDWSIWISTPSHPSCSSRVEPKKAPSEMLSSISTRKPLASSDGIDPALGRRQRPSTE